MVFACVRCVPRYASGGTLKATERALWLGARRLSAEMQLYATETMTIAFILSNQEIKKRMIHGLSNIPVAFPRVKRPGSIS